jgi:6-phosphogluconolactonase/glucosamine-6-phosphate isomerase/deaminase
MRLEVYEQEIDAIEAAAAEAAARIAAAGEGAAVAVPAGRRGRALLAALATCADIPWASTRWFVTDEVCGEGAPADSGRELLASTLLDPNRVPASAVSVPDRSAPAAEAGRAWEEDVRGVAEAAGGFAVVVLAVAPDGRVAGLEPGMAADGLVVVGRDGCVSIGAAALATARAVVVLAVGTGVQGALREALTAEPDPTRHPLQRVLPEAPRVTWFVDRAAVAGLLAEACAVTE